MTWFQEGLDALVSLAGSARVSILCSEEDPLHCHRHWLIAKALASRGVTVYHIRKGGGVQAAEFSDPSQGCQQMTLF